MIISTPVGVGMLTQLIDDEGYVTADPRDAVAFTAKLVDGPHEGQFYAGTVDQMELQGLQ